jgi:hypothetical protein
MDNVITGRLLLLIITLTVAMFGAFRFTPELDDVKNSFIYRVALAMMIARGLGYLWFDIFNLFPIAQ